MGDELAQAQSHLNAAASALAGLETAPDVVDSSLTVTNQAVDLEPAARAAETIAAEETEQARIAAAAAVEQARIAAATTTQLAESSANDERLTAFEERLSRLEARAHDHNDEEEDSEDEAPDLGTPPGEAVAEIEEDAAGLPEAPETPEAPAEPKPERRAPRLHFRQKSA